MRFTIDRQSLMTGLQRVYGVVPARSTVPVLTNVLLNVLPDKLEIVGTDLEMSVRTSVPIEAPEAGAIAVPARPFHEVVRELPDIPIEFEIDGLQLFLRTPQGEYRFPGTAKEEYPAIVVEKSAEYVVLPTDALTRMVNRALFAVSTDQLRLALTGVLFEFTDNELRVVATDGHRLSRTVRQNVGDALNGKKCILPTKSLNVLLRNTDAADEVTLRASAEHMVFELGDTTIYSKLIAAKYPQYERTIPMENQFRMIVGRDDLAAAVRRVRVFSSVISNAVTFKLEAKSLEISAEDEEYGGGARETLTIDYDGPELLAAYNAQFLIDILRHIDTPDVIFRLQDSQTGALVFPSEQVVGEEFMMVIMPVMLGTTATGAPEDEAAAPDAHYYFQDGD
ncbi:MAG: DNA polymerase III subunit beta [Calditrichaeota bacterium]|nr:DNA polymerase III subunit beta [Calditrichota bacterium]